MVEIGIVSVCGNTIIDLTCIIDLTQHEIIISEFCYTCMYAI